MVWGMCSNLVINALFVAATLRLIQAGFAPWSIGLVETAAGVCGVLGALVAPRIIERTATGVLTGLRPRTGCTPKAMSAPPPSASAAPTAQPTAAAPVDEAFVPLSERADAAWVVRIATAARIPQRAMAAYAGGALAMAEERPECGIGWNTLAAIGFVESEHATIDGTVLDRNGRAQPDIVGIPLDGTESDAIVDTDGGFLDGDAVWDRAVGPMQFIPDTWAEFARDGDGDGFRDPQQIDDAVLTAADYLCEVGGDLTQPDRWIAAIAAYNSHTDYNNRVADAATIYAGFH